MNTLVRLGLLAGALVVGTYLFACGFLWWMQDALLFHPADQTRAELDAAASRAGIQPFTIQTEDGVELYGWHAPGRGEHALLFLHGNGGRLEGVQWLASDLDGVDVYGISYRGFPGSEGEPSEAGMVLDARALWAYVTEDQGFAPEDIVVQGLSMGGGVTHHLLMDTRPAGAVFDSTFLSLRQLASEKLPFLPVGLLLRHPFLSIDRAPRIGVPSLVLHGNADRLIPIAHGRALAERQPDATWVELEGGRHNDWSMSDPAGREAWYAFLERVWGTGVRP